MREWDLPLPLIIEEILEPNEDDEEKTDVERDK